MATNRRLPKDQVEQRVFTKFAEICPIQIKVESIESRPDPEPDIRCITQRNERIAFEMVRCDDARGSQTISRGMSLEEAFRCFLRTYPRSDELLRHLGGRDILPYYHDGITENQMKASFQELSEFLLASDVTKGNLNPFHPIPWPKLQKTVRKVSLGDPGPIEPTLHYYPANWLPPAEDAILGALQKKILKNYQSKYPVELLVWFGIMPEFVSIQTWRTLDTKVPPIARESGFKRLWVFSWGKNQILWVYPHSPN
ncbi:MAG: hypothetical protein HY423_15455 [Candidatus Lambdaproteobacteria bacterium]|nr:hypothetical protein [Candidatus Lambdaproteobacteria bacterium]